MPAPSDQSMETRCSCASRGGKGVVATAIHLLAEGGRIDYDTPVGSLLGEAELRSSLCGVRAWIRSAVPVVNPKELQRRALAQEIRNREARARSQR